MFHDSYSKRTQRKILILEKQKCMNIDREKEVKFAMIFVTLKHYLLDIIKVSISNNEKNSSVGKIYSFLFKEKDMRNTPWILK